VSTPSTASVSAVSISVRTYAICPGSI